MTTLARRPSPAREPDGAGHPARRGLPAAWLRANCPCGAPGDCVIIDNTRILRGRDAEAGP